jgi:hypothetical protein
MYGAYSPAARKAGADAVRRWATRRVFTEEQCSVILAWAVLLESDGPDAHLLPKWPSSWRSTQTSREETARRVFREAAEEGT